MRTWYAAIYLLTTSKKGISSIQLATQLDVTQKTAWFLNHRIRQMFKETAPEMLTGIVEADETFVGGKNKNRHFNKKVIGEDTKTPVLGLIQRNGKVLTFVVPNTTGEILQPLMLEHVAKGATLITDANRSYFALASEYNHVSVKHRSEQGDYRTDSHFHTNNIENFWSTFKRGIIGIYHYVSPKHLHRYTTEFGYRYNNRQETSVIKFSDAVGKSSKQTLSYQKLIGGVTKQKLDTISLIKANNNPSETDLLDNIDIAAI